MNKFTAILSLLTISLSVQASQQLSSQQADLTTSNPLCTVFVPAELRDMMLATIPFDKGGREHSEIDDGGEFWENKKKALRGFLGRI